MAQLSWRNWLNRIATVRTPQRRRQLPVQYGHVESLEGRAMLSGASIVADLNQGPSDSVYAPAYAETFVNVNGTLFFMANDGLSGQELWKTDGTAAGTMLVADLTPAGTSGNDSYFYGMFASGNNLLFLFDDGIHGVELWVSDGTEDGTKLLKDINPNGDLADMSDFDFADVNGTFYFTAQDGQNGLELWKSNGTTASTVRVTDLLPGNSSYDYFANFTAVGDKLFFTYFDSTSNAIGRELWVSDGTAIGTQMVKDIDPAGSGLYPTFDGREMAALNGFVYFVADDGTGSELWRSDGTAVGTTVVADLTSQVGGNSYISSLIPVGNTLFFVFDSPTTGMELWKTDGTANGTQIVKDINPNGDGLYDAQYYNLFEAVDGILYFMANDGQHGTELWRTDGTSNGTTMVADLIPGPNSPFIYGMQASGGNLYLIFDDGTHGRELWRSDGTAAGTVLVEDINPAGDGAYVGYLSHTMADLNGTLIFVGNQAATGAELWKTDPLPTTPVMADQQFNIAENSANGTSVGTLVVTNPSSSALTFAITNGNGAGGFALNPTTGQITVANRDVLNFETSPVFTLTVTVTNSVNETATATVTINLLNVNEAPTANDASFNLDVSSTNGAAVGTVTATDPDAGQTLTYAITAGNTGDAFAIDPVTGAITVANAAALDISVNPQFNLTVTVTDNGNPAQSDTAQITITLEDNSDTNDVPALALNGGPVLFAKKSAPVAIAPNLTVTDPDESVGFRLGGGTLTLSIDLATKKSKSFDTIGGLGGVSSIGSIVSNTPVNGRQTIAIQLNQDATPLAVQNFLRGLTFSTKGAGFKQLTRTLRVQVTDAAGAASNQVEQTINVQKKKVKP